MISVKSWVLASIRSNKDYAIGICCFSAKHAPLRRKWWFGRNHLNVFEWGDMSVRELLFQ